MDKEIFKQNIEWNIDQIAVQFAQAENVKGRAKSGFYKAAVVLGRQIRIKFIKLSYATLRSNKKGH